MDAAAAAVNSLPRLFSDEMVSAARRGIEAELFGQLVVLDDAEVRNQFQSVGGVGFPVVATPPPREQRDEPVLQLGLQRPETKQVVQSKKKCSVSIGARFVMAWAGPK